jgi:phosphotransferase system IIB component
MFKMIRTVADRALLVLMALPLSALAATEDFSSATWTNHQDLGTEVVINDLNIAVPSGASMKGVTVPAAIQIGYDPTRVATSVTISPASQWDRLNVSAITLTDLFQMPVPGVKLIGLLKGQQVAYAEADSLWTDGSGATTVSLTGFNNIDELKITGDVADETNSDVFFFIESLDYQLIAVPPEIVVILDSAGDAANTITAEQLNAVDGVSGALEANEPFYREEVARLSVDDLDTAAEIQTLVDGVNRSVASVPVADIPASVSVVEGDEVAVAVTATDSNNDPLSYSLQAGSPAWLSIDNFASYTTTLADTGDFEVNPDNAAEQSSARGVARDSLGNIYFAVTDFRSGYKGAVAKIATDGSVSILAGSAFFNPTITTNFEYIYSVAVDGNGNVYAADVSLKKVFKISGNTVTEFLTNVNSKGMVFANDGYLYVSNSNQVLKVNTAGVVEQTFSNITDPYGLDVDSSGNIYVASEINRVVYKVTAAGDVSVYAGIERARGSDDGISGTFRSPTDVALDQSTGELYVTDATNHLIRKVATDGTVSTIAGTARASGTEDGLDAKFNNPAGLLMTATGDLIITDKNSGRIRHLSLKDNLGLSGIAPDPTGASESFQALINIDDGFGNTTVHTLNVTVLDAELDVITNAAGDRFNQVTDVQLNAVDGVSGALVANEAQYQAVIAGLTAEDLDTAAEIQALVNSVNSVPVFTSGTSTTALEGDAFSWDFVATDSAGDALTFTTATRLPAWLALSDSGALTGTPTNSDVGETVISVEVSDSFGNTVEQTLTITVLDAEINTISTVAGSDNATTAAQLNAVDGVSGALVANEAQYQAVIAGSTAENLDTAAEIQALVNSVNSVPVFTSGTSTTALEGDAFSWSFVATDSANDALIFAVKTGTTPSAWMTLSAAGVLTGTPLDADVGLHNITVEVSDGFGNTVEQTLAITVLDAEIDAVASVAGVTNGITATELNAVEGVTGALSENNAKYQAAIAALTSEDLDSAAEIQTLVNSVNSVPQFVSEGTLRVNTGERAELVLSAVDAGDDEVTFSLAEGSVLPSWLTLAYRISPLPAGFTVGEPSLIPALVPLPISDKTSASLIAAPSASDYGTYQVTLVAEDGFGNSGTQLVTVIVNAPGQLSISGEAAVGQTLSASVYDANNIDSTISYSWMSEATEVSQAQSYVVQASDLGNLIALQVTYTDADTTLETLSSISDIIIGAEENAFNNIADQVGSLRGQADADDYLAAGVTSVDAQTLDRILPILNAAVGQQEDAGDVDSAAEIEALIATIMEGQDDDCDGLPNMLEGIADTDGDGIIDRNDTDADNDGIRDNLEYGSLMTSSIRLDAAIVVDRDSSELTSAVDDPVSTCSLLGDSDRDGIIDFFDISPYGDGKVRSAAFVGTLEAEAVDENLDGVRDDRDSKEEFIAALDALIVTSVEDESRIISPAAFLPIRVVYNVTADVDSDGLINSLDLDADNDGVIDLIEAGHSDDDTNGLLDEGTDLIEDAEALVDSDADGIPDFLQLKSDGVTFDLIKAGILSSLDGNNDGRIDSLTDVDLDGLMDVIDNAIGFFGSLEDFDGDGIPNHLDDDDDGDGIPDREENDQFSFFTGEDADGDGIDDGIDALINGIIQGLDTNNNGVLDDRELADLDGDGIADYLDIDADGDGIRDDLDDLIELFVEEGPSQAPVLDADADGDGVLDSEDVSVNSGADVKAGGAISTAFYMLILTILAFTARARRTLVAFVMMFGLVAQANAGALSVEGGVGFARFDPDLQITPSESDTLDAGASIGVGVHLNDELGLTLSYFNLGDASINTARISYRATSLALQYRPSFARAGGWALQVEALGSDIDMSSEKGLQVDDSDEIVMGFGLGADYQVNDAERIELMFNRLSSDVDFFSVSYRLLFEI